MRPTFTIIVLLTLLAGCRNTPNASEGGGGHQAESVGGIIVLHGVPDMFSKGNLNTETYYKDQQGEHRKWETTVELMAMPGYQGRDWVEVVEKALSKAGGKGAKTTITIVVEQTTPLDESEEDRSSGPKEGDPAAPR